MTQDELIELLNAHEWRDVEFKEAQRAVPRNSYETVSAFANTDGGHLVFGVRKSPKGNLVTDQVDNETGRLVSDQVLSFTDTFT